MNSSWPSRKVLSPSPQYYHFNLALLHQTTMDLMASPPNAATKASGTTTSEACEWPMARAMLKWLGELYWLYHLETICCNLIPTKQWIKGLCKMNVGLKMNPSLPSMNFERFFPHLRRRLCSTQGIFQNSWRCFCLGGWLGGLGNGSICTPNLWFCL